MIPLNEWIKKHIDITRDYFMDLTEVADPEDYLQVNINITTFCY